MEQTSKRHLIIGTIVVIAIVGLVMWFSLQNQEQTHLTSVTPQAPVQTGQPAAVQENNENINISAKDSSDAALNQDIAGIDKQMSGLDQDSSAAAEGLNTPAAPQQ